MNGHVAGRIEPNASRAWLEVVEEHARVRGEKIAVSSRLANGAYAEFTFAQLSEQVQTFASLFERETEVGAIIPMCLSRGHDAVAAIFGALVSGRAFCCVNPKLRAPQIEHIVAATGAACSLIDESGLLAIRGDMPPDSALFAPTWWLRDDLPLGRLARNSYQNLSDAGCVAKFGSRGRSRALTIPGHPALGVSTRHASRASRSRAQAVGACLFTSGSTGRPKGVLVGSRDLFQRAQAEVEWYGLTERDVLLNVLPFSFDVGLNQLLSAFLVGAELVVLESWFPQDILKTTEQRNVTGISGVPSIWSDLMRDGACFDRRAAHRHLRYITVSGGDLALAQQKRLAAAVSGAEIFKTYGQTEAFRATSLKPCDYQQKPLSVGKAFQGVHIYVVREDGTLAQPNELGEVVHSGLGVMLGYLDGEDPQCKLRDNPWRGAEDASEKVVFTGDIGFLDQDGFLHLSGRQDDLAKIQGNRVYPSEVRNHIALLPGVASVEVIVVRTAARTELAAFVVLDAADSSSGLDAASLRMRLQREVPSYMVPELFFLRESLPRTMSGKPDRVRLAAQAVEHLSVARDVR